MGTIPEKLTKLKYFVGNTPVVRLLCSLNEEEVTILAKYEAWNFTGSIKDRMALQILDAAYTLGNIKPGDTIVEATSGNTGIAFAAMGAFLGHPVHIYMPSWLSEERKRLLRFYGANLFEITEKQGGFLKCIELSDKKSKKKGYFGPKQFESPWNVTAHTQGTAPELENALKINKLGDLDVFIPKIVDLQALSPILRVRDSDAINISRQINKLGLSVGISSGANVFGAILKASMLPSKSNVSTILCDGNKKYLSTDLCSDTSEELSHNIKVLDFEIIS